MIFKDCYIHLEITALARKKGVVQQSRKKDIWILLWVLLFGFATGSRRTLVGLWETYNQYANDTVSSSTFQGWLSEKMAAFLKALVQQTLNESCPICVRADCIGIFEVLCPQIGIFHHGGFRRCSAG